MGRLIVVTGEDRAPGFRLAGVGVEVARSPDAAARVVSGLLAEGRGGVIAVDEPLLAGLDPRTRQRFEESVDPMVVSLPSGVREPGEARRARLAAMLRRAIGYRITFGTEEG
jgi:vacuolar-type H+-ATPase subunit F/Vma7